MDEVVNPMKCFVDMQAPQEDGRFFNNKPSQCTGSQVKCDIKQFFIDNRGAFEKIQVKLKSLPSEKIDSETHQRISSLNNIFPLLSANRGFSNKEPKKAVQRCWKCGDAILAVTASADLDILNHNKKHYDPICEAIGKKSISY